MQISAGDVLLARFPYTDLSADKRRPVLVLSVENDGDDIEMTAATLGKIFDQKPPRATFPLYAMAQSPHGPIESAPEW